ncbi:hypothetical protein G3570_05210 [Balneolaceae bacterium YR4-1]|uniref:Diadenylate cyclase n=1 Tax=Halalkalibaculum roseum TaxID=2709311 RepID=A0A6M1SZP3_9BACT|nr:diadenylate cyclase [Halalkalibaculum roseum]NGP76017.1 hypothetical protein [Halalkalibaculum roseum]
MIRNSIDILQDFLINVRIADVVDVALISVFLYLILNWLRQSASRQSIIGIVSLFALYVMARFSEMYLTELLIEGLFAVILIGIVVVFQSDIRRLFERIGNWSIFWKNSHAPFDNRTTNIITEAVAKMAENKTGALLVLKGKENIDRHIHGGIPLEGKISIPLLHSIFNPKAPGHDGAVILEGERIIRFGAHLPLSTKLEKLSGGGTRHAAALGLAEQCDALVVVVSEERGSISIARDGTLQRLESVNQLKGILNEFWETRYETKESPLTSWWQSRDLRTAAASVILAVIFWFAFAYQSETVYRTFSVPIEYRNLQSSNLVLQDSIPLEARLTLSGSDQAFRLFDQSQLVVSFNLTNYSRGEELVITESNVNLPSDLSLYEVSPRSLKVRAQRLKEYTIPIEIPTRGTLPGRLSLISIKPERDSMNVFAVDSTRQVPRSLLTEPVDLSSIEASTELPRNLVIPENIRLPDTTSRQIGVAIKVKAKEN